MTTWEEYLIQNKRRHSTRRPPSHNESRLQSACVRWFRYQYPDSLIFAIPNGGKRTQREAEFMKEEGVMAGVADLEILMPDGKCAFIEMKTLKGRLSEHQLKFQRWCFENGHVYLVCKTLEQFMDSVKSIIITYGKEESITIR